MFFNHYFIPYRSLAIALKLVIKTSTALGLLRKSLFYGSMSKLCKWLASSCGLSQHFSWLKIIDIKTTLSVSTLIVLLTSSLYLLLEWQYSTAVQTAIIVSMTCTTTSMQLSDVMYNICSLYTNLIQFKYLKCLTDSL